MNLSARIERGRDAEKPCLRPRDDDGRSPTGPTGADRAAWTGKDGTPAARKHRRAGEGGRARSDRREIAWLEIARDEGWQLSQLLGCENLFYHRRELHQEINRSVAR